MVFNATLDTISVISWWSVLLGKETGMPQVTGKCYHMLLYRVHLAISGIRTHTCHVYHYLKLHVYKKKKNILMLSDL